MLMPMTTTETITATAEIRAVRPAVAAARVKARSAAQSIPTHTKAKTAEQRLMLRLRI